MRSEQWIINEDWFGEVRRHGNTTWAVPQLVTLAVLWVWSDRGTLGGAFAQARQLAVGMFGSVAVTTYQGLTKALSTWSGSLESTATTVKPVARSRSARSGSNS